MPSNSVKATPIGEPNSSQESLSDKKDPLLEALVFIANQEDLHVSHASLVGGLPLADGKLTPELYVKAASRVGLTASVVKRELAEISNLVLPAVLLLKGNNAVVLTSIDSDLAKASIYLPLSGELDSIALNALLEEYQGYAIYSVAKPSLDARANFSTQSTSGHWFWGTLGRSWKIYRDVLVASLFINLFVIANPLFVMNVYDRVVPNSALETLWALALGVLVLYMFDFALKMLRNYFIEIAGKKSDILLSTYILERILGAKFESHPKSVGAFVSNLREFETVRNFITSSTITTFIDLPFVVLFLVVIAYIGGPVVWVSLALIPMVLGYSWYVHLRLKKDVANSFSASAQKNATLVEAITQLETVKTFNAEGSIMRKWELAVGQLAHWGLKTRVLSNSATTFAGLMQQLASVFVIIVGVYLIAERELTQGALIACVILSGRVLAPFAQISGLMVNYYQSKLALESLDELVAKPQEHEADARFLQRPILSGAIDFKNVSFVYPEEQNSSLQAISLSVKAGERIAIIGKMGSGKSTLQKLLLGLYRSNSGNILYDGVDICQFDPVDIRNQVGYVAQESQLFFGTIRDNIMFGQVGFDDEELVRVAQVSGVSNWVNSHPNAFERNIGERGELLSGGQKQTISIARAFVGDPSIVIMDEPSSSMDNASEANMIAALKQNLENKTLILVTHKVSMLALVDRLIVLDGGRIVADGKKDSVLSALKKGQLHVSA